MRSFRLKYLSVLLLFTCLLSACLPAAAAPTVIPVPSNRNAAANQYPQPDGSPNVAAYAGCSLHAGWFGPDGNINAPGCPHHFPGTIQY